MVRERMTSRERVFATLDFRSPDRLPRDIWGWRHIQLHRPADWALVTERFPLDMDRAPSVLGPSLKGRGERGEDAERVDEWGCVWRSLQPGTTGEVIRPALSDLTDLDGYRPPYEMLEHPAFEAVQEVCRTSAGFRLGEVGSGPFERMQFLRGSQNLYLDLAEQRRPLFRLIEMVHEFCLRHCELWCRSDVDAVTMGDDWGSQTALLVSPELWRRLFRPLYAEYFELVHAAGKRVFFHSDGMICDIIPDLLDLGVDALNCQVSCMDIEELGRSFRGKVTFWGELCRQFALSSGNPEEVRREVRRMARALGGERGGFIAQLSWGLDVPTESILAAFDEWNKQLP